MTVEPGTLARKKFNIPSLNGLRAVAVMIVFVGHGFTAPYFWPGHVGVTIFFFLSGYLITTLGLAELLYRAVEQPLGVMRGRLEASLPTKRLAAAMRG